MSTLLKFRIAALFVIAAHAGAAAAAGAQDGVSEIRFDNHHFAPQTTATPTKRDGPGTAASLRSHDWPRTRWNWDARRSTSPNGTNTTQPRENESFNGLRGRCVMKQCRRGHIALSIQAPG